MVTGVNLSIREREVAFIVLKVVQIFQFIGIDIKHRAASGKGLRKDDDRQNSFVVFNIFYVNGKGFGRSTGFNSSYAGIGIKSAIQYQSIYRIFNYIADIDQPCYYLTSISTAALFWNVNETLLFLWANLKFTFGPVAVKPV